MLVGRNCCFISDCDAFPLSESAPPFSTVPYLAQIDSGIRAVLIRRSGISLLRISICPLHPPPPHPPLNPNADVLMFCRIRDSPVKTGSASLVYNSSQLPSFSSTYCCQINKTQQQYNVSVFIASLSAFIFAEADECMCTVQSQLKNKWNLFSIKTCNDQISCLKPQTPKTAAGESAWGHSPAWSDLNLIIEHCPHLECNSPFLVLFWPWRLKPVNVSLWPLWRHFTVHNLDFSLGSWSSNHVGGWELNNA